MQGSLILGLPCRGPHIFICDGPHLLGWNFQTKYEYILPFINDNVDEVWVGFVENDDLDWAVVIIEEIPISLLVDVKLVLLRVVGKRSSVEVVSTVWESGTFRLANELNHLMVLVRGGDVVSELTMFLLANDPVETLIPFVWGLDIFVDENEKEAGDGSVAGDIVMLAVVTWCAVVVPSLSDS